MSIRRVNPSGPLIPVEDAIRTYRGKRTHFLDPNTGAALCGAGLPNREFPFGSVEYIADQYWGKEKPKKVQLTCYRCAKILYMDQSLLTDDDLVVRDFSPTHDENRDDHVMIPQGRKGYFRKGGENKDWEEWLGSDDLTFDESPWIPGPERARTQPGKWGIPEEDILPSAKEFETEFLYPEEIERSKFEELPETQAEKKKIMEEARGELNYYRKFFKALGSEAPPPKRRKKRKKKLTPYARRAAQTKELQKSIEEEARRMAKERVDVDIDEALDYISRKRRR